MLAKLDPENHGPSGHLVTADQRRGVARKRQSTSARSGRESAAKKLKMSASIPATSTRSAVKETAHRAHRSVSYATKFEDSFLTPTGILRKRLDHAYNHWPIPVRRKGVSCQICRWARGKKNCAQIVKCEECDVHLCTGHFKLFHTSQTIVEDKLCIAEGRK